MFSGEKNEKMYKAYRLCWESAWLCSFERCSRGVLWGNCFFLFLFFLNIVGVVFKIYIFGLYHFFGKKGLILIYYFYSEILDSWWDLLSGKKEMNSYNVEFGIIKGFDKLSFIYLLLISYFFLYTWHSLFSISPLKIGWCGFSKKFLFFKFCASFLVFHRMWKTV